MFFQSVRSFFPEWLHTLLHASHDKIVGWSSRITIGKTAFHGHDITDIDWTAGWNDIDIAVRMPVVAGTCLPFRKIISNWVCEEKLATFIEHHHNCVERNFGHRCLTEQCVFRDRCFGVDVSDTEIALIKGVAVLDDFQSAAWKTAF